MLVDIVSNTAITMEKIIKRFIGCVALTVSLLAFIGHGWLLVTAGFASCFSGVLSVKLPGKCFGKVPEGI